MAERRFKVKINKWRDVNAIYQIYPMSFMDGDNDGAGDLRGVIQKLDYIKGGDKSLGIDAIWFSPIFPSPLADMGYDVSDYKNIHPDFGTLHEFKELLKKAHARGIKVMLDLVPSHSSDQHPWFLESRSSRDNQKNDYYVWHDGKPDGSAPNNWQSMFGGSSWEWDEGRQQYYLHTFLKEQPDLNWDNPKVREEMKSIIRFWFDLGVDGFRVDAIRHISKDEMFRDDPKNPNYKYKKGDDPAWALIRKNSRYGKNLFKYLAEITDVVEQYDDRVMIFEDYPDDLLGSTRDQFLEFYNINPKVSAPFNFTGIGMPFEAATYSRFINEFQGMLGPEHFAVYCFGNHDNSRLVSRIGKQEARAVALLQMTLPGTPIVYYGDELGMRDVTIKTSEARDMSEIRDPGKGRGRDPERTPMRWDASKFAGFSDTRPWLPVGGELNTVNVEYQLGEPNSFLSLYRRLLKLRSQYEVLSNGDYETFSEETKSTMMFSRRLGDEHVFVAINFTAENQKVKLPHGGRILCCSNPVDYPDISKDGAINLRPYEAILAECAKHPLKPKF